MVARVKCFIDVDGVVAYFVKGFCDLVKKDVSLWPVSKYAFPYKEMGLGSEAACWELIGNQGPEFWANLELMPDAHKIVSLCESMYGTDGCAFLTSPPATNSGFAAHGKYLWIAKHFPSYKRRTLVGACKDFCANENTVLIDDFEVNCDKFRAAGGRAILLPRPWNKLHKLDAATALHYEFGMAV